PRGDASASPDAGADGALRVAPAKDDADRPPPGVVDVPHERDDDGVLLQPALGAGALLDRDESPHGAPAVDRPAGGRRACRPRLGLFGGRSGWREVSYFATPDLRWRACVRRTGPNHRVAERAAEHAYDFRIRARTPRTRFVMESKG